MSQHLKTWLPRDDNGTSKRWSLAVSLLVTGGMSWRGLWDPLLLSLSLLSLEKGFVPPP